MQRSARKEGVFGAAWVYTVAVPGPRKSWVNNGKPLYALMAIGPILFGAGPERAGRVLSSVLPILAFYMIPWQGFSPWHSTEAPSGLRAIVKQDPKAFLTHVVSQPGNGPGATLFDQIGRRLLLLGSVAIIGCLAFWRLYAPEAMATASYAATLISVFAIRGQSFEPRYAGTLHVAFALLVAVGCVHIVRQITSRVWGKAARLAAVTVSGVLVGGVIAERTSVASSRLYQRPDGRVKYEAIASEVNERLGEGKPVVAGTKPYFYSRVTGSSALSIPEASDGYLKSYTGRTGSVAPEVEAGAPVLSKTKGGFEMPIFTGE